MTYNGFKNYETWNVALWLQNDEGMFCLARGSESYKEFYQVLNECGREDIQFTTPDGVRWDDPVIDIEAIQSIINSFH